MQKFFVMLAAVTGLGIYVVLEPPLGKWGALATGIVLAVTAMWLVTLIPAETQNDARIVAVGLSVLGWLYLIAILLKKGSEQADKVGLWAVIIEAALLTGPVWVVWWVLRRMAQNRKVMPQTVPSYSAPETVVQGGSSLSFADDMRVGAISGILLGYAGQILNPDTPEPERQVAYTTAVAKATKALRKRPRLGQALMTDIRGDEAPPAVRQLAEQIAQQAAASLSQPR